MCCAAQLIYNECSLGDVLNLSDCSNFFFAFDLYVLYSCVFYVLYSCVFTFYILRFGLSFLTFSEMKMFEKMREVSGIQEIMDSRDYVWGL